MADNSTSYNAATGRQWGVDMLRYTTGGLALLYVNLLLGGAAYHFLMQAIQPAVPIILERNGISNATIGLIGGTIPSLIAAVVNPIFSFTSDRTRSRFGRRIPYIAVCAIIQSLMLVAMGFSEPIGRFCGAHLHFLSQEMWTAGILAVVYLTLCSANTVGGSVMFYLFPDVVPPKRLGRFMAMFSMTGAAAGFVFSKYFFGFMGSALPWLFTGTAIAYLLLTLNMCWRVKEGDYPPLPPRPEGNPLVNDVKKYAGECFSSLFFWCFFICNGLTAASMMCRWLFNVLFAQKELGLTLERIGEINAWSMLLAFVVSYPIGMLIDRIHPIRVYSLGIILIIAANLFGFKMIHSADSFLVFSLIIALVYALQNSTDIPLTAAIFPKKSYGQFCSASAMVRSLAICCAGYLGGLFIDLMGSYRYLFIWDAAFTTLSLLAMCYVYWHWRKHRPEKEEEG